MSRLRAVVPGARQASIIGAGLLLAACGAAVPRYNAYVASNERVAAAWAQVRNVEQRRMDLIPQLIAVVDANTVHERAVTERLAAAQLAYAMMPERRPAVRQLESLDSALTAAISLRDRHARLRAAPRFRDLTAELRGAENRIAIERVRYNQAVAEHRELVRRFPVSVFARTSPHEAPLFSARRERVIGVVDEMPSSDVDRFRSYLDAIERETGIDVILVFTDLESERALESYAASEASLRGLGRETGLQGVLVVYDRSSGRIRLELGYGLEPWFSDAFVGRLLEQHAASFFRTGDTSTGLRLLVRIIHERIRDELLGGTFDATPFEQRAASQFVTGGAGATAAAPIGRDPAGGPAAAVCTEPLAQPTVEAAYAANIEWLRPGGRSPNACLLTAESRELWASRPETAPYFDHMLAIVWNERYEIVERGDVAMIYYTSTPLRSPLFLRRGPDGWQFDVIEEIANSQEMVGFPLTWRLRGTGWSTAAFGDLFVSIDGVLRVRGGDNRRLPTVRAAGKSNTRR